MITWCCRVFSSISLDPPCPLSRNEETLAGRWYLGWRWDHRVSDRLPCRLQQSPGTTQESITRASRGNGKKPCAGEAPPWVLSNVVFFIAFGAHRSRFLTQKNKFFRPESSTADNGILILKASTHSARILPVSAWRPDPRSDIHTRPEALDLL